MEVIKRVDDVKSGKHRGFFHQSPDDAKMFLSRSNNFCAAKIVLSMSL